MLFLTYWLKISLFWFEDTPQLISGFLASEYKFPLKKAEHAQCGNEAMDSYPFSSDHLLLRDTRVSFILRDSERENGTNNECMMKNFNCVFIYKCGKHRKKHQFTPTFIVAECERTLIKHNNHAKWIWDLSMYVILRLYEISTVPSCFVTSIISEIS